jgi:hypothetical protein
MKQIYSILTALFATFLVAFTASANQTAEVKFHCSPEHVNDVKVVSKYYSYATYSTVIEEGVWDETGTATFTYDIGKAQYYTFTVADDSEYLIKGFTFDYTAGTHGGYGYPDWGTNNKSYTVYLDYGAVRDDNLGAFEGTIELQTLDEKYSDTLYLTVDDPVSASVRFSESYREIDVSGFEPGVETAVKFDASEEMTLCAQNGSSYSKGLYQVLKNGEKQDVNLMYVNLAVASDDHVQLLYNYPDVDYHVSFSFADDVAREVVTGVTVDDVAVENFKDGFDAKAGSRISIYANTDLYNISMMVNGEEEYFYSSYWFTLAEDTSIAFSTEKKPVYTINVIVDNADCVGLYLGYNVSEESRVALVNGENQVEVPQDNSSIVLNPFDSCEILSILQPITDSEGVETEKECYNPDYYSRKQSLWISADGMTLKVYAQKIERNNEFVFYVDNSKSTATNNGFYLSRSDSSSLLPDSEDGIQGYSVFNFGNPKELADGEEEMWPENKFKFSHYGDEETLYNQVYVNDELADPYYTYGTYYELTLSDKDVVKVFVASVPEFYSVSFDVPEGVELSVVKDLITEASTDGFQALTGTQVDLTVSTDSGYDLYVNDEKVEVEEDAYSFNVAADTVVKVDLATKSGVSAVSAESSLNNIYNLQGIKVGTSRNQLPAGIYIINGKKVAVK